ncbi:bpX6 domain-containing protein [Kitasatospora sp. NPDC004289]
MTATPEAAFRAVVTATGYVLDVPVIGEDEATARVLELWTDGADLRRLLDGRWLFTLAAPAEVRADRAPGLPVLRTAAGGSATLGADAPDLTAGQLALAAGGSTTTLAVAALAPLDPAERLDLTGLTVHRPRPLGPAVPEAAPVAEALPERPRPDLRAAARIAPPTARARRLTAERPERPERRPRSARQPRQPRRGGHRRARVVAAIPVILLLLPLLWVVLTSAASAQRLPSWGLGLLVAFAVVCVRSWRAARAAEVAGTVPTAADGASAPVGVRPGRPRFASLRAWLRSGWVLPAAGSAQAVSGAAAADGASAAARAKPRRPLFAPLLARLTMRTAGGLVRGRQARYLRELTRAFEQHQFEDALRDAIRLSGGRAAGEESWLTLGLPRRHAGELRATPRAHGPGGTSVLSGPDVHQHLAALYRGAAEQLERSGRIDEAAYVLADLLDAPAEAVGLLARHGRLTAAAELAEGRGLAADLVVRLWWRAGERTRAVRTAHRTGVFARAVELLSAEDPDAARELRSAWAEDRRASGDRLGAAEALWPDPALRPSAAADLSAAVALGGPTRSRALPYLLALGAGDATRALALAVLDSTGDPALTGRSVLAAGLAQLPAADPAVDRELATAAARAVVRDGGLGGSLPEREERARHQRLLGRADPLVAADLAKPRRRPATRGASGAVGHTAADRPGTLPVLDAALLGSGSVLVACGQAGVRLLTPDGRTKAQWDVPADQLVLADHGGSALLVASYGQTREVSRLDLATRTVRPWTTLRASWLARSYDGRHLITADGDGIVVLDALASGPTAVWRELGREERLVSGVARSADGCAAVVASALPDGSPLLELWHWELPGWQLRSRQRLEGYQPGQSVPLAAGGLLAAEQPEADGPSDDDSTVLRLVTGTGPGHRLAAAEPDGPIGDGDHWALPALDAAGTGILLHAGSGPSAVPAATVHFPGADLRHAPGLRQHADAVTYWHRSGRILATSTDGTTLRASLRVTGTH